MGKKKPQLNRRGKERKSSWWPPLWECCKLCFPEALGAPLQRWNLRAWKTGPASPERGMFSCEATVETHIKSTISSADKQLPRSARKSKKS
ncbi:hypothetical protein F7725_001728 [Dissostichus mawsoni]|uniref:Uncharacterized protein n=1 Tax=Dissostichus mawsoni TaxID=36200 RepID=A0A7J5Y266_DISMA|nr:hypothetical protein F7725_001728 [Dissostichus mawsoni]